MDQTSHTVERLTEGPDQVGKFFEQIPDVSNLATAEKEQEGWKVEVGEDLAGVAVVQTEHLDRPLISRIAVAQEHRKKGIATSLVEHMTGAYEELHCLVKKDNESSRQFFEQTELEYEGMFFDDSCIFGTSGRR